mmetsp:Transcript_21751/g.47051  ORF Transcript_21751/g.47051 Transcript_21751/m.47051 type:complete len:127 (+) Transcript_21751:361-741(+)
MLLLEQSLGLLMAVCWAGLILLEGSWERRWDFAILSASKLDLRMDLYLADLILLAWNLDLPTAVCLAALIWLGWNWDLLTDVYLVVAILLAWYLGLRMVVRLVGYWDLLMAVHLAALLVVHLGLTF